MGSALDTDKLPVIKLSILMLYLRLFQSHALIKWAHFATAAALIVVSITTDLAAAIQCSPIAKACDITILDGHCLERSASAIAGGTLNKTANTVSFSFCLCPSLAL